MWSILADFLLGILLLYLLAVCLRHLFKTEAEGRMVAFLCAFVLLPSIAVFHWYAHWNFSSDSALQNPSGWWTVSISDAAGQPNGIVNLLILLPLFALLYLLATLMLNLLGNWYRQRSGTPLQNLHLGLLKWLVVFIGLLIYLKIQGVSLTPLFFGMGAVSIVVGLALQDPLSNLFAGLTLDLEGHIRPGDWLRIDVDGGTEGKVIDKGWRTTRLLTVNQELVTLPNRVLGGQKIINYYWPDRVHGHSLRVATSYADPPAKVKDVLRTILLREPRILKQPQPVVRTLAYGDSSIEYELRFFINNFSEQMNIKDEVMTRIWYAFNDNGIEIPFPIRTVYLKERPEIREEQQLRTRQHEDLMEFFRQLSCLKPHLAPGDYAFLAENAVQRDYAPDEALILKGTMGDSVFFVRHGWCRAELPAGRSKRIETGEYVGEMALMNLVPRSATVKAGENGATIVRIDRESLLRLFRFYPALRQEFVKTLTERQQETGQSPPSHPVRPESLGRRLRKAARQILRPW